MAFAVMLSLVQESLNFPYSGVFDGAISRYMSSQLHQNSPVRCGEPVRAYTNVVQKCSLRIYAENNVHPPSLAQSLVLHMATLP